MANCVGVLGSAFSREHAVTDQAPALVLTHDHKHLADLVGASDHFARSALVTSGHRLVKDPEKPIWGTTRSSLLPTAAGLTLIDVVRTYGEKCVSSQCQSEKIYRLYCS